jgi:hypothetical protein
VVAPNTTIHAIYVTGINYEIDKLGDFITIRSSSPG